MESVDYGSIFELTDMVTIDALRLDIIICQHNAWLDDGASTIDDYINMTIFIIYSIISIAMCIIIVYVQLEDTVLTLSLGNIIHGIISRYKTVAVAQGIDPIEIGTADAYGWILCVLFGWIVFVIILLRPFGAAIMYDWILYIQFKWIVIVVSISIVLMILYWQFEDSMDICVEYILLLFMLYYIGFKIMNEEFIIYIFDVGWFKLSTITFVKMILDIFEQQVKQQQVKQQQQYLEQPIMQKRIKKCANSQVDSLGTKTLKNVFENNGYGNMNQYKYDVNMNNKNILNYNMDCNDLKEDNNNIIVKINTLVERTEYDVNNGKTRREMFSNKKNNNGNINNDGLIVYCAVDIINDEYDLKLLLCDASMTEYGTNGLECDILGAVYEAKIPEFGVFGAGCETVFDIVCKDGNQMSIKHSLSVTGCDVPGQVYGITISEFDAQQVEYILQASKFDLYGLNTSEFNPHDVSYDIIMYKCDYNDNNDCSNVIYFKRIESSNECDCATNYMCDNGIYFGILCNDNKNNEKPRQNNIIRMIKLCKDSKKNNKKKELTVQDLMFLARHMMTMYQNSIELVQNVV